MAYIPSSFNEAAYLAANPDVAAAVAAGVFSSGLQHYELFGQAEHRNPNTHFNEQLYLLENIDVAAAVEKGIFSSGIEHFEKFGYREPGGRELAPGLTYDESQYLAENPDVAAAVKAGIYVSGWQHYALFGADEGRGPVAAPAVGNITATGAGSAGGDTIGVDLNTHGGQTVLTASNLVVNAGAGLDSLRLSGDADLRIDFTNPANQLRGIDLNGDGGISNNGVENNVKGAGLVTVSNFEIVDAYARNPIDETDASKNFLGDISYDGTGFAGDGVSTDGNIFLGGLGADKAFGGIGNDFLAGGGVAATRNGSDYLSGGRNADFMFGELSALDNTDGNFATFDGGTTADDTSAGNGQSSQDSDWFLVEASDDNEPATISLSEGGSGFVALPVGAGATLVDIENVDASGNLYGFLNDVDVELGGRRLDDRDAAPVVGTENFSLGSTAQLNILGSTADNKLIGGYDNDSISGNDGDDLLFGGNLSYLLHNQNNPNLLDATGGLDLNVNAAGVVTDGIDALSGDAGNDGIIFEMDGGTVSGGGDRGTTSADTEKDTGDTLFVTNFSMGRLQGATVADEATAQADALDAMTKDSTVRFDLGNDGTIAFRNYGGANAASQDQSNYVAGVSRVAMTGMESVITTGLGDLDFVAAGTNDPELKFNNQQNFLGLNADVDLRGNDADNTLYANTGTDKIEGRGGDDNLSGGSGDDDFVFAFGDGVDTIHRQKDADGNNLWDRDADGNGLFVQDFRAPQDGDVNASRLTIDFGTTDLTSVNVAVTEVQVVIGGTTFSVNIPLGTNSITAIATLVDNAYSAIDPDVSVTSVNNTLLITDTQGRDISDTVAEGYLVAGAVANGTLTTTATLTPGGQLINIVEDDRLIIKTYDSRAINLGTNETTNEINNAADMVVKFDVGADGGTVLAQGQDYLVRLSDVHEGDAVSLNINGKIYSYTAKAGETSADVAAALVAVVNDELDLNSASGQVAASVGTTDAANFDDTDGLGTNVAVISLTQDAVRGSQTFMDLSVTVSNSLTGTAAGSAEIHNQADTQIDLYGFDGRNGNLNAEDVLFLGRGTSTVSILQTALNAGGTLTGKDATDDLDTKLAWINGDDLLIGGDGNDIIKAGTGDDVIIVSKGTDTVDGGGNVVEGTTTVKFVDVLQVEQSTFGEGSNFTVALDGTLGANGAGTVTVGGTAAGVTTFTNIETVRVLENSRDTTLSVQALSNSIATAVGTNPLLGVEGLVVNLTRANPSVTYTADVNNDGDVTDKGDFNGFVATDVFGAENVIGGNANDTVNIDVSQITADNTINLGAQQDNTATKTLGEGADTVTYDHTFLTAAADVPTVTVAVESAADTDMVSLTGGVLGEKVTTDTLVSVEVVDVTNAATGLVDKLDLSAFTTTGATVNYGNDVGVGATLGGSKAAPTTVAGIEADTLESGGVSATGTGLGNEKLEIVGIDTLEHVTGSAAADRVILGDSLGTAPVIAADKIGVATYLGAATVTAPNIGLYQFSLGDGSDTLDYQQEIDNVAVLVDTSGTTSKDWVIVDDGNSRIDFATDVERYFGGQGSNIIDLTQSTVDTTITFSAESKAAGNEFAEPNGVNDASLTDLVRGVTVKGTGDNAVFATFMERTATGEFWKVVVGNDTAEKVVLTDNETPVSHTFELNGGANVVDYSARTLSVKAEIQAEDLVKDTQSVSVGGDTITVTAADYASGENTLTVIGSSQNSDTVDINKLGGPLDSFNLVDLKAGVAVSDVFSSTKGSVIHFSGFENITGSDAIDHLYGSDGVNSISGSDGADWIIGRGGQSATGGDQLTGGTAGVLNADRFIYETESDSATATANSQDTITDFTTGTDFLVFTTSDGGAVKSGAAASVLTTVAATSTQMQIDQNGNGSVADAADDDYTILDGGNAAAGDVIMRVTQSSGQDIQHLDNQIGVADGQYEIVYTSASESNNLALPDEFHNIELGSANTAGMDKFDLRAFDFGSLTADVDGSGKADATESILFSTPATVNSLTSVTNFFRVGATDAGAARAVHVQQEAGTDDLRVFVDVNSDGNYTQADDLVFDLRNATDGGTLISAVAGFGANNLQADASADGTGSGIFIFTDAQYNLWA